MCLVRYICLFETISTHFVFCVYWFTLVSVRISISSIGSKMSGAFERLGGEHPHHMLLVARRKSAKIQAFSLARQSNGFAHARTVAHPLIKRINSKSIFIFSKPSISRAQDVRNSERHQENTPDNQIPRSF